MKDETFLAGLAMICMAILESVAICFGFDGAYFSMVVAAIAGIAGYEIKALRNGLLKK